MKLVRRLGKPIIATSANISGKNNLYGSKAIIREFKNQKIKPDLILDAGIVKKVKPSTIVQIYKSGKLRVLRKGPVRITNF